MRARLPWRSALWIAPLAAAVTSVFMIDFCALVYQCGCGHLWGSAVATCNIHQPGVKHCPWCSVGRAGYYAIWLGIVVPQSALSLFPRRWGWGVRLAAALAAFPLLGAILALGLGLSLGYWDL
jgi:hypothetical protein